MTARAAGETPALSNGVRIFARKVNFGRGGQKVDDQDAFLGKLVNTLFRVRVWQGSTVRVYQTMLAAAAIGLLSAPGASAAVLFSDNFDLENSGVTQTNYAALQNFDISGGAADLMGSGSTRGATGSGAFIDLDGTAYSGATLTTKQSFDFLAGDLVTLSFDGSGNQRRARHGADDDIIAGFIFADLTTVKDYTLGGGFGATNVGNSAVTSTQNNVLVRWNSEWTNYTVTFLAAGSGSLKAFVGTNSDDNYGPMIDNFQVSITNGLPQITSGVPEPTTWAMMIVGFGLVGAATRSRRGYPFPRRATSGLRHSR